VQAIVALLSGAYRLSKRAIAVLLWDLFGVHMSIGSVTNLEAATSSALAQSVQFVVDSLRHSRVVHADETSWPVKSKNAWLWVLTTAKAALFMIRPSRGAAVAMELIHKGFPGILVADGYTGYHWFRASRRQLCWAHLIRHFRSLFEFDDAKELGERFRGMTERIFTAWHHHQADRMSWAQFTAAMAPLQLEFGAALRQGAESPNQRARSLCKGLIKREESLWTFVRRRGVEPTNNRAERALRHAVMWRKTSFGCDSEGGARFVERVLTVVTTLRLRGLNVLNYLEQACRNVLMGDAPPLLDGRT
jgi:transposase